ncbi:hypothetical protein GmHk_06G016461 [Glycine max]|nr:hypothetical protein GmHk_06G016461 [Glycine max]KAH1246364.1 hypothetical protein GmHk_06G016461 [Glycine max]
MAYMRSNSKRSSKTFFPGFLVSHRLFEMFKDNNLLPHWNAPGYRSKCAQAKNKNKKIGHLKKGGCMRIGGSISLEYHTIRFSETLGRLAYTYELFQQTHLRKDTDQFVDDRSRQAYARLSQARSDVASSVGESQLTPLDPVEEQRLRTQCWVAARKGCLYGTGDLAHSYKCGDDNFMQRTQGSSSHAQDSAEINRLREKLHQSKEEMHSSFSSYLLKHETLFININNLSSSIRTNTSKTNNSNKTMTNQMINS